FERKCDGSLKGEFRERVLNGSFLWNPSVAIAFVPLGGIGAEATLNVSGGVDLIASIDEQNSGFDIGLFWSGELTKGFRWWYQIGLGVKHVFEDNWQADP